MNYQLSLNRFNRFLQGCFYFRYRKVPGIYINRYCIIEAIGTGTWKYFGSYDNDNKAKP